MLTYLKYFLVSLAILCLQVAEANSGAQVTSTGYVPNYAWDGLASDSTGKYIYAMSFYPNRLYTSVDYGSTWDFRYNMTMYNIATNSSGGMVAGTGSKHMFVSYDYGITFTNISIQLNSSDAWLNYIAMSSDGQFVYTTVLGTSGGLGAVLRSNDSGQSYYNVSSLPGGNYIYSLACNAAGNFVAVSILNFGLYTSFDFGDTFALASIAGGGMLFLALDITGQYILGNNARSTDYGANWTTLPISGSCGCSSNNGDILYLGSVNNGYVYASYNQGAHWNKTSFPFADYNMMVCNSQGTQVTATVWHGKITTMIEVIPPTSQPSSQPSSRPSCAHGDGMNDDHGGCSECAPGTFASSLGGVCEICPVGYYTSDYGETECSKCPYPTKSVFDESDSCDGFTLNANITTTLVVLGALVFIVMLSVLSSVKRAAVIVNLIFPTLDLFSDIAYLMTNDFYSPILFALGVLFVVFPIPSFLYTLVKRKAVMPRLTWRLERLWWLSVGSVDQDHIYFAKFPCFGGDERFPLLSCAKHDNLCSLTLEGVVWVIAIVSQILTIVGYPLLILANIVFLFVWLFVGMFLYLSKTIAVGNVWNLWFQLWTGTTDHNTEVDVDTEELNGSLQHEFYFETLPQVILQLVNNILLKDFTPLAIFSLVQSLVMALNGIWRFGYYRYVVKTPVALKDIPIDMTIRLKLERFGIDIVLLDGRLEPNSKKDPSANSRTKADLKQGLMTNVVDDDGKKTPATPTSRKSNGDEEEGSSGLETLVEAISAVL